MWVAYEQPYEQFAETTWSREKKTLSETVNKPSGMAALQTAHVLRDQIICLCQISQAHENTSIFRRHFNRSLPSASFCWQKLIFTNDTDSNSYAHMTGRSGFRWWWEGGYYLKVVWSSKYMYHNLKGLTNCSVIQKFHINKYNKYQTLPSYK